MNCRYTEENLRQMMDSRVDSTRAVGRALEQAARPPAVWLQMSTATIYADRRDAPNDEVTGIIGGDEPDVPAYWEFSVRIAQEWEAAQQEGTLPATRRVALRAAMVMSPDRGGVFDYLPWMARLGLGGPVAGGGQYVSWIHADDLCRAIDLLVERDDLDGRSTSPHPGRCRSASSCATCAARGVVGRGCPPPAPWRRTRRLGPAHRHRAAAQEPSCRARPAARRGIRVRLPVLAGRGRRPGGRRPLRSRSGAG